jgi:hypothetical protein
MTKNLGEKIFCALLLASAALQGCAGARPATPAPLPAGTQECLRLAQLHSTRAVSDREIIFRLYGGQEWTNQLPASCTGLRFNRGFTYNTSLHRLCRGQFIHTLEPGRSTCVLGLFRQNP